jgi:hypothetical protein
MATFGVDNVELSVHFEEFFSNCDIPCLISGFCCEVDNCTLLGCYAASSGNSLLLFQDSQLFPSSRVL